MQPRWWRVAAAVGSGWLCLTGEAHGVAEVGAGSAGHHTAVVRYSHNPATVVVSLTQTLAELREADPGPSLRVYGNGRVVVHYPRYMQRAGDYVSRLTRRELEAVLQSLAEKGVLDFDGDAIRRSQRQVLHTRAARGGTAAAPELFVTSDASTTTIEVHVDRYAPAGQRRAVRRGVSARVAWAGVQMDAQSYPELPALRDLAAAEQQLLDLMQRPDLRRLDHP